MKKNCKIYFENPPQIQVSGKLTEEEYAIMKSHTTLGYNLCMKDLKLRPYSAGAYYHHEALNGSGYPQGLYHVNRHKLYNIQ